ncbi:MAG: hypothetical protein J2P25_15260, partial [Nocardiopsaceae bacterium]|nr:hypothetical protein [Nocardiopsaceae bacterium]
ASRYRPAGRGAYGPGTAGPDPAGPGSGGPRQPGRAGFGRPAPGQSGFQRQPYGPGHAAGPGQGTGGPDPAREANGAQDGVRGAPPGSTTSRPRPQSGGHGPSGFERAGGQVIRQRDAALPDPMPGKSSGPIAAIESDNVATFARDLRALRAEAEMDYPEMAESSHYTMRTLASAAGGLRLPTLPVLMAYVTVCGGDLAEWEERWGKLKRAADGQAALPTPETPAAAGTPQPDTPSAAQPPPTASNEVYVITSVPDRQS